MRKADGYVQILDNDFAFSLVRHLKPDFQIKQLQWEVIPNLPVKIVFEGVYVQEVVRHIYACIKYTATTDASINLINYFRSLIPAVYDCELIMIYFLNF